MSTFRRNGGRGFPVVTSFTLPGCNLMGENYPKGYPGRVLLGYQINPFDDVQWRWKDISGDVTVRGLPAPSWPHTRYNI